MTLCNKCRTKIVRKRAKTKAAKRAKAAKDFAETKRRFRKAIKTETLVIWGPPGVGKTFSEDSHA